MVQLLHAVSYLHSLKVIHRDLKLENCFLDGSLNLVLGDFGVSKRIENTVAKTFAGTPQNIAPEVVLG